MVAPVHAMAHASPANPLRIGLILADVPGDKVVEKYGDYVVIFNTLLHKAAANLGLPDGALEIKPYDALHKLEYPNLDDVDAILITGSKYNAYDNDPWILKMVEFTKEVLAQDRVRIIGVCFGHQILGRALGSVVRKNSEWEVAVCDMELAPKGKEIFGVETLAIQQMHLDIVEEYPEGAQPLGSSPTCKVQGMYYPKRYISVQGHPEFNGGIVTAIVNARAPIFKDEKTVEDYKKRAMYHHDGIRIAEAFLKFLQE